MHMVFVLKALMVCWILFCVSCGAPGKDSVYVAPVPTESELRWEEAHDLERSGNVAAALIKYHATCSGRLLYQRACYDYCRLLIESGDVEIGRGCAEDFITARPNGALAPVLAKAYAATFNESGQHMAGVNRLEQLATKVDGSEAWDTLQYQKAALLRRGGMIDAEETALMAIVEKGRWGSQLWDNSIWRVIGIQQRKGDAKTEERLLLRMLSAKESSKLIASYHSPYYDDALFRLGHLYREMGELEKALKSFMTLANWKTSRLRDDALLASAKIKEQVGEREYACAYLSRLVKKMPDSSSYRKGYKLFQQWRCEGGGDT